MFFPLSESEFYRNYAFSCGMQCTLANFLLVIPSDFWVSQGEEKCFPKVAAAAKIWNKVTKCSKTAENALCPIHFPFAKTCFEAINLGEAILKAGFKSKNSKVKVRELVKT